MVALALLIASAVSMWPTLAFPLTDAIGVQRYGQHGSCNHSMEFANVDVPYRTSNRGPITVGAAHDAR
jgi:hypothetical protein